MRLDKTEGLARRGEVGEVTQAGKMLDSVGEAQTVTAPAWPRSRHGTATGIYTDVVQRSFQQTETLLSRLLFLDGALQVHSVATFNLR